MHNSSHTITYLALTCECSYPELWAIMHDIIARDPDKWLTKASFSGDLEFVQYAAAKGAQNWEWCAIMAARGGHLSIVQYADEHSGLCGPNAINWSWCMSEAARGGHLPIVRYAADHGATNWSSCMTLAAHEGHLHIVQYIAERISSTIGARAW